ncbi:MAG: type II toxin-antitoxin system RelE/ParE family toxin [Azospirillaceae bacterium]|nr:type II toxin-antitoxin system RelE/ParE family toxin [Azospirillaceae bacterium]
MTRDDAMARLRTHRARLEAAGVRHAAIFGSVALLGEAVSMKDLMRFPSNRVEAPGGDRQGQFSIRINQQWRICFTFADGDAYGLAALCRLIV